MGIITELRNRSWIVLSFIALALIGFLVMSSLNKNTSIVNQHKNVFASIDGNEVSPNDYNAQVSDVLVQYLTQQRKYMDYKNGNFQIDDQTLFQIKEQAWQNMVSDALINKELDALGITITEEEYSNLIYGPDPHPYIKSYYSALSPTGKFDPSAMVNYVNQISNQEIWAQNPQAEEEYYNFIMREKLAREDYAQSKYTALFANADYVPQWMAKRDYELKNRRANFDFVDIPFTTVADSTIQVSESDMKQYFERNKNKYKQKEESRVISYVMWNFTATAQDSAALLADLRDEVEKIKTAKNDSAYIAVHSEDPQKTAGIYTGRAELYASDVDSSIVDSMFMKPVGSNIGPYYSQGYYKVANIRAHKNLPDSVDVRHIVIALTDSIDDAKARATSENIIAQLNAGAKFDSLAAVYSMDQNTSMQGGELGWLTPASNLNKPLKEYIFETGKVGEYGLVKLNYGYHVVNIKEQRNRRDFVSVYYLSKAIQASSNTADSINQIANVFYESHKTPESFEQGVKENNLKAVTTPPLNQNQYEITGLPASRSIIEWAFGAEKDEFNTFNPTGDEVIIVYVKNVRTKGVPEMEEVADQLKGEVIREKKGEQLKQKMQDAVSAGGDLSAIAQKVGSTVKNSQNASLSTPYAQGVGLEPKVVGSVMATEQGKQTAVVAGNRGVYVAVVTGITEPLATQDYTLNLNQLKYGTRNRLMGQNQQGQQTGQNVLNNLLLKADVVDNRYKFQ